MSDAKEGGARVVAATLALWLIWGSTYLAILWAIQTMPPFLMGAARFLLAGTVLFTWGKLRGASWPRWVEWRSALFVGVCLMTVGNGGIIWAEGRLPTGLAALLIATVPLWMVGLEALRPGGERPGARVLVGVALGLGGVAILVSHGRNSTAAPADVWGVLACLAASFCWSLGSTYSRRAPLPKSPQVAVGMEMLCGGAVLVLVGWLHGETAAFDLASVGLRSWLALAYLAVFGSLVGLSSYFFLLHRTTPAVATTYAYVNPVVAVLLGWALAGESITGRTVAAMAVIVAAVVLITTRGSGAKPSAAAEPALDPEVA